MHTIKVKIYLQLTGQILNFFHTYILSFGNGAYYCRELLSFNCACFFLSFLKFLAQQTKSIINFKNVCATIEMLIFLNFQFQDILKPSYNSVDMSEVELMDTELEARELSDAMKAVSFSYLFPDRSQDSRVGNCSFVMP